MNDELKVNATLQSLIEERLSDGLFFEVRLSKGKFIFQFEVYKDDETDSCFQSIYGQGVKSVEELNNLYTKILEISGTINPQKLEEVLDYYFEVERGW